MAAATAPIPLSREDRAILALESETIAGHTCKVVVLGGPAPEAAALRAAIDARIAAAPALTRRLGGPADAPAWVPDERFDAARHVVLAPADAPLDATGLRAAVARLFAQRLDRAHPLWRIDALPLADGGTALVWRIHHALADGTAAMRYARALLWDPGAGAGGDRDHAAAPAGHDPHAADEARRRAYLARVLARELPLAPGASSPSPFDGQVGAAREVAFATVALAPLRDAAKALAGATLNDAVLTAVGGGVRRWLEAHHGHLGGVRVKVPVSLHHAGDEAGNRDSFFAVTVPLADEEPVARLRAVHAATSERKAEHDAEALDALLRELAGISPRLGRFAERVERSPRTFALNVSNVPGPRTPVSVLGAPVRSLHSLAEIGDRHALRVAVISLADRLCFGFCADPAIVDGVATLAAGTEAEAAALVAAASA